jgi:hypothetical protein
MLTDSDPPAADLPEKEFFAPEWTCLPWTPWIPFSADKAGFHQVPTEPGLYRIRATGKPHLMYIGETKKPLHQRLLDLRMELKACGQMPWSDPHAESPALWAWQDAEGLEYECSAAPLDASTSVRRGMESHLLYRYRQEQGVSSACSFGRFHPRYRRSTERKANLRGGRLVEGQQDNPAAGPSYPPLVPMGGPGEPGWMGLTWSSGIALTPEQVPAAPAGPGVFVLTDSATREIVLIGQSGNCAKRLAELGRRSWERRVLLVSVYIPEKVLLPHQLRETETDLTGNFFEYYKKSPEFQFRALP